MKICYCSIAPWSWTIKAKDGKRQCPNCKRLYTVEQYLATFPKPITKLNGHTSVYISRKELLAKLISRLQKQREANKRYWTKRLANDPGARKKMNREQYLTRKSLARAKTKLQSPLVNRPK